MQTRVKRSQREPTIALINIVFLMLVFFMVTGTLSQPLDKSLKLVRTTELEGRVPPDALVIHADGRMTYRGAPVANAAQFVDAVPQQDRATMRVVPDQDLPARSLVKLTRDLRQAGAQRVLLVSERALQ